MTQQTAPAESITLDLLETMIQTNFEGKKDTLRQQIENAVEICVAATTRHAKPAVLTVRFDFTPADEAGQIDVFADVDTKLPKPKPMPVRLYGTKKGELFVDDPDYVQPAGIFGKPSPTAVKS